MSFSFTVLCFWVGNENRVENTLMLWVLLSRVHPKSRTVFLYFVPHVLPVTRSTKETGRDHSQNKWTKLSKGIFHTPEPHVSFIDREGITQNDGWSQFGKQGLASVSRLWIIALSITFWPSFIFFSLFVIINHYYCIFHCFQLLNFSYLNLYVDILLICCWYFGFLSPCHWHGWCQRGAEWVVWFLISIWYSRYFYILSIPVSKFWRDLELQALISLVIAYNGEMTMVLI